MATEISKRLDAVEEILAQRGITKENVSPAQLQQIREEELVHPVDLDAWLLQRVMLDWLKR